MAALPSGNTDDVKPLADNPQCTEPDVSEKPPEWPDHLMPHVVVIYYLFAGPEYTDEYPNGKPSSFSEKCRKLNASVIAIDNIIDPINHDILQPEIWEPLKAKMRSNADGGLLLPPRGSFCPGRNSSDGGPRPLRGHCGRDLYGLPDLWPEEMETAKVGTGCIVRTCEAAQLLLDKGPVTDERNKRLWIPWIFEQPKPRDGQPSGMNLNEVKPITEHTAVHDYDRAQCPHGAATEKLTRWKGTSRRLDL